MSKFLSQRWGADSFCFVLTLGLLAAGADVQAAQVFGDTYVSSAYYELESAKIEEVQLDPEQERLWLQNHTFEEGTLDPLSLGAVVAAVNGLIQVGSKIWTVVEKNRPVVTTQYASTNVLPETATHWMDLENWQEPKSRFYRVTYTNLYGIEVVRFAFRVIYAYGGMYNGKGQYLSRVTVVPAEVNVAWGFTFNANGTTDNLINLGTKEDPLAGIELGVDWTVDTVLQHKQRGLSFFVQGDGKFKPL